MPTTPSTRLSAVNTIISNVGQSPVNVLDTGNPLVEMAEITLDEITRAVLSEGWQFNTEKNYPFVPDSSGHIIMPFNILAISAPQGSRQQLVKRSNKLYDRVTHSFVFTSDQQLDVTWLFDFEDCPEAFKNYITIRAANVFAGRSVGSQEAVTFGAREETVARATLMEYDTQQGDYTIFADRNGGNTYNNTASRPLFITYRY